MPSCKAGLGWTQAALQMFQVQVHEPGPQTVAAPSADMLQATGGLHHGGVAGWLACVVVWLAGLRICG